MRFASPWAFAFLLIIPLYVYYHLRRNSSPGLTYSSVNLLRPVGISWRQHFSYLPLFLRCLSLALLITGLARPQQGTEKVYDISHGIAIEMVIDRSSSMGEEMFFNNRRTTRLEVVKTIFHEFVNGNDRELSGRPSDLIGIVSFARFPETVCPLTLAHEAVNGFIEHIELVTRRDEDGTSIGDGIALAAARLQKADEIAQNQTKGEKEAKYEIKSKIIILLTDGAHNAGSLSPMEAAELASEFGIKIYTIGIGQDRDNQHSLGFFARLSSLGRGVDKQTLQDVAAKTGGIFRMASDDKTLRAVYTEIDNLEKSEIESVRHIDYAEYFHFFVLAALGLLLLETIMKNTLLRKIP